MGGGVTYDQAIADLRQRCADSGADIRFQALHCVGGKFEPVRWAGRDALERYEAREGDRMGMWPVEGVNQ